MEVRAATTSQSPSYTSSSSWLSGEYFSSMFRELFMDRAHKAVLSAIRTAGSEDWRLDATSSVVSLRGSRVSATFFPKSTGEQPWLVATTPSGEVSMTRDHALAPQFERRLDRRLDGYRAQEARELTPEWLTQLSRQIPLESFDWRVERGGADRRWFGEGSYTEEVQTLLSTTTPTRLAISVRRLDSVTFVSLKDAQREDLRYAQQSVEFERQWSMVRIHPEMAPFGLLLPAVDIPRPTFPLRYGVHRSVEVDVHVNSLRVDELSQALGLPCKPIATLKA